MRKADVVFLGVGLVCSYWTAAGFAEWKAPDRVDSRDGVYKIIEYDAPENIHPGQQVFGKVKMQVIKAGKDSFTRPFARFRSLVDDHKSFEIPTRKVMPWKFSSEQKVGDVISFSFFLDVPMDFPSGRAELTWVLTRKIPSGQWEYAVLQDGTGKAVKTEKDFTIPLAIVRDVSTVQDSELPVVVRPMRSPVLDGQVNPKEWDEAGEIPSFTTMTSGPGTQMYLGYDQQNLYLAYVCHVAEHGKNNPKKFSGHDPKIFNSNDTVYACLNPTANLTNYMLFAVDTLNQQYDALGSDPYGFNPIWKSAVSVKGNIWSAEISIPFSFLGKKVPSDGDLWYVNFGRLIPETNQQSGWPKADSRCPMPGEFGRLVFGSIRDYLKKSLTELKAFDVEFPSTMTKDVSDWQSQVKLLDQRILSLKDDSTKDAELALIAEIESLREQENVLNLKALRQAGKGLIIVQTLPYGMFKGDMMAGDLPAKPVQTMMLQDEWTDLAWNLTNMTDQPITVQCSTRDGATANAKDDWMRLPLPGLEAVWSQAMPVAAGDGHLSWDAIIPNIAGLVQIYPKETVQVWLTLHVPANVSAGMRNVRIIIQPTDGSAIPITTIPLSVQVLPVRITEKRYFNLMTWNAWTPEVMNDSQWYQAHLKDAAEHGVNVYLLHNLNLFPRPKANPDGSLIGTMEFSKLDAAIDAARKYCDSYYLTMDIFEHGNQRFDLFGLDFTDPNYGKAFKTWFAAILKHLKTKGITDDNLVVNPSDETTDERCQQIAKWIKEVDPQCRVAIDSATSKIDVAEAMNKLTDIWIPHYHDYFPDEFSRFHAMIQETKKVRWVYFYSEGGNEKLQDANLHYLAKFWWAYRLGIKGMGYWANQYRGDSWNRSASRQSYDPSLIYPVSGGVVPSRRWQAWRRGWQDYNLLSLLKDKLSQEGDQANMKELDKYVKKVIDNPGNQKEVESVREWVKSKLSYTNQNK